MQDISERVHFDFIHIGFDLIEDDPAHFTLAPKQRPATKPFQQLTCAAQPQNFTGIFILP